MRAAAHAPPVSRVARCIPVDEAPCECTCQCPHMRAHVTYAAPSIPAPLWSPGNGKGYEVKLTSAPPLTDTAD